MNLEVQLGGADSVLLIIPLASYIFMFYRAIIITRKMLLKLLFYSWKKKKISVTFPQKFDQENTFLFLANDT